MAQIVGQINAILWSKALIILILGSSIFFSFKTRFLQVRHFKEMIRIMFRNKSDTGVSSFQALAMTLGGRVGSGNIAGVATAIALGGPGAVFWMWVTAFLGASTSYIECTLAQIYKKKIGDEFRGGPAYFISEGLNLKWYAYIFALVTVFAGAICLTGVQANCIAASVNNAFGIKTTISTIIICILTGVVIFGGVKRIGRVAEIVVPFMAIGYIIIALIITIININELPGVIALIFKSAFAAESAFAGLVGSAIAWGVKRGIYSNEAGQGSAPNTAAAADVDHPAEQGLVQAFSVYIDTLFVCSATAFMILITGKYNVHAPAGGFLVDNLGDVSIGPIYTQLAVETVFKGFGSAFVAISLFFFAFTSIMYLYYLAETNLVYIAGQKKSYLTALRAFTLVAVFYGGVKTASLAWAIGDIGVGLMSWLNIIAILFISKPALKALEDYEDKRLGGDKNPIFDPVKLGIKNADFWTDKLKTSKVKEG